MSNPRRSIRRLLSTGSMSAIPRERNESTEVAENTVMETKVHKDTGQVRKVNQ